MPRLRYTRCVPGGYEWPTRQVGSHTTNRVRSGPIRRLRPSGSFELRFADGAVWFEPFARPEGRASKSASGGVAGEGK